MTKTLILKHHRLFIPSNFLGLHIFLSTLFSNLCNLYPYTTRHNKKQNYYFAHSDPQYFG